MAYDFSKFKKGAEETEQWFKDEISLLRTGRATPALVENIKVDYYGVKNQLKSISSISVQDARTLMIKPWDTDATGQIEQAVGDSDLGLQAITEKNVIRIVFPELTEERRKSLLKLLSEKLEEARISLRREREEVWRDIQNQEKEGKVGEDDKFRYKDELQKMIEETSKKLEEITSKKEEEISR